MSSITPRILRFLGSMNLAITLLMIIAIASVIGTILRQNEPYQNYIVKFGPFWHRIYRDLGLYDIYSTGWFVLIMAFLVMTTSLCLYRNTPKVLAALKQFQLHLQAGQLRNLPVHAEHRTTRTFDQCATALAPWLQRQGYRVRSREDEHGLMLAGMKGRANRYGYICTHLAIVIICIGGLMDSNFPLKVQTRTGQLNIENRNLPLAQLDPKAILPVDNRTFRASVSVPEGRTVNTAFINMEAGYLVQPLPFSIHVKDFRIEHYPNGQPKSFASDLVLLDREHNTEITQTIEVNHPLSYRGYTIYQASFGDGGSELQVSLHDLAMPAATPAQEKLTVSAGAGIDWRGEQLQLEISEFRKFNIFANEDPDSERKFRDFGPAVTFTLRQSDGTAREYLNYMYPVVIDDREFLLSGTRDSLQEDYRYLHIPAGDDGSIRRFMQYLALLKDDAALEELFRDRQDLLFSADASALQIPAQEITRVLVRLVGLFLGGGFDGLQTHFRNAGENQVLENASLKLLQFALQQAWLAVLDEAGEDVSRIGEREIAFLNDSILALSALHRYGSPFYLQLDDFKHVEATGLQITRSPGTKWVYLGFLLLITGVFLLFYVPHEKLWFRLSGNETGTTILFGGTRTRHQADFERRFGQLCDTIKQAFPS